MMEPMLSRLAGHVIGTPPFMNLPYDVRRQFVRDCEEAGVEDALSDEWRALIEEAIPYLAKDVVRMPDALAARVRRSLNKAKA